MTSLPWNIFENFFSGPALQAWNLPLPNSCLGGLILFCVFSFVFVYLYFCFFVFLFFVFAQLLPGRFDTCKLYLLQPFSHVSFLTFTFFHLEKWHNHRFQISSFPPSPQLHTSPSHLIFFTILILEPTTRWTCCKMSTIRQDKYFHKLFCIKVFIWHLGWRLDKYNLLQETFTFWTQMSEGVASPEEIRQFFTKRKYRCPSTFPQIVGSYKLPWKTCQCSTIKLIIRVCTCSSRYYISYIINVFRSWILLNKNIWKIYVCQISSAVCDIPCIKYWRPISNAFPEAKFSFIFTLFPKAIHFGSFLFFLFCPSRFGLMFLIIIQSKFDLTHCLNKSDWFWPWETRQCGRCLWTKCFCLWWINWTGELCSEKEE